MSANGRRYEQQSREKKTIFARGTMKGVMNGPLKFLTDRKIYLCSICSQNLNECSLARAPKILICSCSQARFLVSIVGNFVNPSLG